MSPTVLPKWVGEWVRIVPLAADGTLDTEIDAQLGISNQKAPRGRARFLEQGLPGLEKDASWPGPTPSIDADAVNVVVRKNTKERPANATHWSTRSVASEVGMSEASVRRIWKSHGLRPHLVETFKISNDPKFAEKLEAIIG